MEIKLTVNGKEVALTEEQIKLLGLKEEKRSVFNRHLGGEYYHIAGSGSVYYDTDRNNSLAESRFNAGNYCADEELMKQRALHEILNRLLWRASIEAGELDNPWDYKKEHWFVYYDYRDKAFYAEWNSSCKGDEAHFPTKQSAQKAIEEIVKPFMAEHPEFVW